MTFQPILAAAGLACLTLGLPGAAAAQSGYCLDVVTSICGSLPVNQCMTGEEIGYLVPAECIGDVQTLFEMANEYDAQVYEEQAYDPAYDPSSPYCDPALVAGCDPGPADSGMAQAGVDQGYSFGGNLRGGPGDEFSIVGSLPEGAYVVLSASGTWSGGYQWFFVESDYGMAYHWGGLMCSMDYYVDGVLQVC